ncbi:Golgin subfamily A member 7/ERF4 family-domain-containing protein [Xylaria nigripes]|nr:Golgin subfamily A member 7/ERF4 family-domain-containing protein [Xylaria nigripes]
MPASKLAPVWTKSANLFIPFPLSGNIINDDFRCRCRCAPSPRNRPSHRHHDIATSRLARLRHRLNNGEVVVPLERRATRDGKEGTRAGQAVAAALSVPYSQQRLPTPRVDPQNLDHPPPKSNNSAVCPTRSPRHHTHQNPQGPILVDSNVNLPFPPFRNLVIDSNSENRLPRPIGSPGRLWNPTNSTPRFPPAVYARKRRPSTPLPPAFPINHPTFDASQTLGDQIGTSAGDYPLLTLPEQRQIRHPTPTRSSFQIDGQLNGGNRISLPSSVRHSYDIKRGLDLLSEGESRPGPSQHKRRDSIVKSLRKRGQSITEKGRARAVSFGLVHIKPTDQADSQIDKGKGKAIMSLVNDDTPAGGYSTDLEAGSNAFGQHQNRSTTSLPGGIGSVISSSNSSIVGDPDQPGLGDEWGPQHPCFPHLNPYVPLNSTEYRTTRIIRVRRDWLVAGDIAPTFSNMYPEILDPAGVPEQEFRRVIEKLNGALIPTFDPYHWRNILDGFLGVLSGWIWEDFGLTNVKSKLAEVEAWIEKWNAEMEKTIGSEDGVTAPKIIPLRRTGYMSLDFQILNPEVSVSVSQPASRAGPAPAEPIGPAI